MIKRWLGWGLLFAFALLSTWLVQTMDQQPLPSGPQAHIPDYTLKNFTTRNFDEQGRRKSTLVAEALYHYEDANTRLKAPTLLLYRQQIPQWYIQAEHGEISPDGNAFWLLGHTNLWQPALANQPRNLEIISQDVYVQLDTEYAETTKPSIILNNHTETHSVGMRVFMAVDQIELFSQVQGHYQPPQSPSH